MKLPEIQALWESHIEIDMNNLDTEYRDISKTYMKFMDINTTVSIKIDKLTTDMAKLKREKLEYYKGWCERPYHKKVTTASDANTFIEGDADVITLKIKLDIENQKHKYTERVLQQLKDRGFHLQGILAYRKFVEGG